MPERSSYLPGTPNWIDLGSPDPAASAVFYGALFGWESIDLGPDAGGYRMCTLKGRDVAGLGPQQAPGPPYWTVYVATADVAATTERVVAGGGTVIAGPMDVMDAGHMAVYQDSVGSFVSAWQAKDHIGCGLVNEPGAFVWNELATNDLAAARGFYTSVFGWGLAPQEPGHDSADAYTVDGNVVCGAHTAGEGEFPAWSVWFAVDDCEASAAKVAELGGSVIVAPNDMGFGIGSVVADPHGAVFGIAAMHGAPAA